VISLASMGWGTSLFGSGTGPIQRTTGKFWVLWVDARNLQGASRSLAESFDWRVADAQGHVYREAADQGITYSGVLDSFLRRQERTALGSPVRAQALTHPLLVFDLVANSAPAELIIQDARGADEVRFNLRTPPAVTRLREPPQAAAAPTARPVAPTVAPARPAQRPVTSSSKPAPRVAPTPIPVVPSGVRTGAICRDGWRSYSTGSGTCSHHGGVDHWLYGP
jgi:hypothetical protein